jgi:hypothetical protein
MSERHRAHNGRTVHGQYKVRQADLDDLQADPNGTDYIRDDVRLGGAVADIGAHAGESAAHIADLIRDNREDVDRLVGREEPAAKGRKRSR